MTYLIEKLKEKSEISLSFGLLALELEEILMEDKNLFETYISNKEAEVIIDMLMDVKGDPDLVDRVKDKVSGLIGRARKDKLSGVTKDTLLSIWADDGYSTRIKDIIRIALDSGFSKRQISKAFEEAGINPSEGSNPKIENLAKSIIEHDLQDHVIKYLTKTYDINESVLYEYEISDKEIKSVISSLADQRKQNQVSGKYYIKKWMKSFDDSDNVDKIHLAKEVIGFLHDRRGMSDYPEMQHAVHRVVKNSSLPSNVKNSLLKDIKTGSDYSKIRIKSRPASKDKVSDTEEKPKEKNIINTKYFRKWVKEMLGSDVSNQKSLVREMVNYLNDRQDAEDYEEMVNVTISVIRRSELDSSFKNKSIESLKKALPLLESHKEKINNEILKNVFESVIVEQDIKTYGRLKRGNKTFIRPTNK